MSLRIKRAYEDPSPSDGYRVLVDRVWPRGKTKESVAIDVWMRDVAPSTELRKWFGHDPNRWADFRTRYLEELRHEPARALVAELADRASRGTLTLVYGAKDEEHNQAVVIAEAIHRHMAAPSHEPAQHP
ncbi:DUF488 domain-containing protein [Vulgatibacter incomptus]|nr:DUF488 domain-containing protein [Vulgatibacter incomptus]